MKKNKNKKTILSSAGNEKLVAVKKKNTTDKTSKGDDERHRLREELRVVKRELINVNKKLSKAKDYTKCIVSTLREPLLILDKNLRVQTANSAFYKAFGGNEKKAKNSLIYELNNGQWNIQELRILMEEVLPEKRSCVGFEIRHHLPHTKDRVLLLNGREIKGEDNSEKIILLAIEDITEERLANDRIKEKEKQYFQLLKTLPVAIYTCDAQGYLTYYNDAAQELWGRKPNVKKDRWGGSLKIFRMNGTPVPLEQCPMARILKGEKYEGGEKLMMEQREGNRRFMVPYPQPNYDSAGRITGATNTVIDVTNLKAAELLARQNEERFRSLVEESAIAMAVLQGPERIVTVANEAMLTLWDRDDGVIGKRLLDFMPEIMDQPFPELLNEVYATGKTYTEEDAPVVLQRKGKLQTLYTDFSYTPLRNSNNEVTDILITSIDVTESFIFKKQLQESEQNFRNIIEQSPVAMCVLRGEKFIIEIANEPMFEIWGKNAGKTLNKPLFAVLPEVKSQGIEEILGNVFTTGERFTANEYQIALLRKGKLENIYVNFVYEALKESDGSISGIVIVATDVTDQIKARQESEHLQQQKDDFLGIASHELKTPVTIIKAYTQILEKVLSDKGNMQEAEMAAKMNVQTGRLNSLIVDLLDTTKINSGKLQFNNVDFDFNGLVKEVLDDMRYTSPTHSIIQKLGKSCIVHADKERIGQVIDNFITNAVKYSPNASKIIVRTELKKSEVYLSVQDFGIGISEEKKDKVFEQFYRVTGSGKQNTYPGMGLGLFISAEIIGRENGKIWVESEEGKGSSFYFSLPRKKR